MHKTNISMMMTEQVKYLHTESWVSMAAQICAMFRFRHFYFSAQPCRAHLLFAQSVVSAGPGENVSVI